MFPFLRQPKDEHSFKLGSKFQDALNLYRFDKKLRLFLFNEIEKVEVGGYKQGLVILSIYPNEEGVSKFNVAYLIVILF